MAGELLKMLQERNRRRQPLPFATARQDETARAARVPYKTGSGGEFRDDLMKVAKEAYEWSPLSTIEDLYKAYKDPSLENVGWAALGAIPGGKPAKKIGVLANKLLKARGAAVSKELLHGTSKKFTKFKEGPHGAIYFSEPKPGVRTQAEAITGGPHGGYLFEAKIKDPSKVVTFDPLNDPKAKKILESVKTQGHSPIKGTPHYVDMPAVVEAAKPHGYNKFKVYEPAAHGSGSTSVAFTDPSLVEVLRRKRVKHIPKDWNDPKVVADEAVLNAGNNVNDAIKELENVRKARKSGALGSRNTNTNEIDGALKLLKKSLSN